MMETKPDSKNGPDIPNDFSDLEIICYDGGGTIKQPNGRGHATFFDGTMYKGEWLNGQPHGIGKWSGFEGEVYESRWLNGKPRGIGKWTTSNGEKLEGFFQDGKFTQGRPPSTRVTGGATQGGPGYYL